MGVKLAKNFDLKTYDFGGDGGGGIKLWDFVNINFSNNTFDIAHSTVNGIISSNLGSLLTFNPNETTYVNLSISSTNGTVSSFSYETAITYSAIPSQGNTPPTSFKFMIGFLIEGVPTKLVAPSPIFAVPVELYRTSKLVNPELGLPYTSQYSWRISQGFLTNS